MTDLSAEYKALAEYRPTNKVRFVTAASLFDGHDAAINIMRRILQGMGAEVIHLGHNRSVDEVVTAALQEDAHGIAISSYQGGHVEYFKYMVDMLKRRGGEHIQVFGGGGGVIVRGGDRRAAGLRRQPHLQPRGRPAHGPGRDDRRDGDALRPRPVALRADGARGDRRLRGSDGRGHRGALARARPADHRAGERRRRRCLARPSCTPRPPSAKTPVLGITGTGGAGKSSLTDELIRRLRLDQGDRLRIAVISIDPSRRKSGGALLGDRIRMNAIGPWPRPPGAGRRRRRRPARLHALAGDARLRQRDQPGPAGRARGLQVRRLRPRRRRDLGHRPGRRRDRAARRRADVRDDAGVRRRQPAREDRHARLRRVRGDQQVRPQGRGRCAARRRQAGAAQPRGLGQDEPERDAGVRHDGQPLQRRRRDRAVPGAAAAPRRRSAWRSTPARCPRRARATAPTRCRSCPGARAALPRRHRRHRARLQGAGARAGAPRARDPAAARRRARCCKVDKPDKARAAEAAARPGRAARGAAWTPTPGKLLAQWPDDAARLCRRRVRREDPRQGDPHRADPHDAVGHQDPQGRAARRTRTTARS